MISHLALSPHPTSWLSDVMYLLPAAFPQVPGAAARWRAKRHDVTTLPALTIHHDRPRRALTTRTAGGRTGLFAESHSPYETGGGRLCSRQVGEATTRRESEHGDGRIIRSSWRSLRVERPDAPTYHPPCGSSTRSSRQARDRLTGRYWHHFPMSPLAFVLW